jgi:nucleoside-diphosphate-sugar epimerase
MSRVLLIGGCGYIGTRLFDELNHDVTTVDAEWFGKFNDKNICIDYGYLTTHLLAAYDVIVVLAGHSSVQMCKNRIKDASLNNVTNFVNLMGKINSLAKKPKVIYASTASVSSGYKDKNAREDDNGFVPINAYDLSKYTIDMYAALYPEIESYGLRFGSVNGFSRNLRRELLINSMVTSARLHGLVTVYGDECYRPVLGLRDLREAIHVIIENKDPSKRGIYNLASFNDSVMNIGNRVSELLCVPLSVNKNIVPSPYNFTADPEKFRRAFNFEFKDTIDNIVGDIDMRFAGAKLTSRTEERAYGLFGA